MANTIQIKRRNGMTNASLLADGEFGFDVSNNTVYIGNNNQNIPIGRDLTHLDLKGYNLILGTTSSDSDDSSDIEWLYGNGQEKARLWLSNDLTTKSAPYFREYKSDGTALYTGNLVLGDGTGASGTWGITANKAMVLASYATIGSSSTTHATALQTYFNANKTTVPRNELIHFYDQSGGNGSATFGYFLTGYDSNPYGGFFTAHYNNAYYIGINNGTYTLQKIITDAGGTMTGNLLGNQTATLGSTANPFHNLVLGGATNATMTALSTNPRITFQEGTGSQPVHMIYTDYDSYRSPAGLKVIGGTSATPAWFEVEGNVYAAAFKGNADTATKLGTSNVGTSSRPIYLNGGTPTAISDTIFNLIYPVGSIYMSATLSTAAAVKSAFGGTWVAWGSGRVPVGVNTSDTDFNSVEKTGGEKTHTLTTTEMPAHSHTGKYINGDGANNGSVKELRVWSASGDGSQQITDSVGGGGAHNNLQPYITCYMYKRTA